LLAQTCATENEEVPERARAVTFGFAYGGGVNIYNQDSGYHESRRCSRDTYPESCITKYTSIRRLFARAVTLGRACHPGRALLFYYYTQA